MGKKRNAKRSERPRRARGGRPARAAKGGASARVAAASMLRVAQERAALRARVAHDRADRYAAYVQGLEAPTEPPGGGRRAMLTEADDSRRRLRILAEGDSWFEYPLRGLIVADAADGVIYRLQRLLGYPIANMAHHGDEVRQMLGLNQRREITARLSDPNVRFDALLFSGGGNDLVGDQFCLWLRDAQEGVNPEDLLYTDRVQAAMACLEAGYRDLIEIRDQHSAETAMFFHGYDFPAVTGVGVCLTGPWLKSSLDFHKVAPGDDQFRVVRALLQALQSMLERVAATSRDVFVVPTQGTLAPTRDDWQNEIHPSQDGFSQIALKFQAALLARFP